MTPSCETNGQSQAKLSGRYWSFSLIQSSVLDRVEAGSFRHLCLGIYVSWYEHHLLACIQNIYEIHLSLFTHELSFRSDINFRYIRYINRQQIITKETQTCSNIARFISCLRYVRMEFSVIEFNPFSIKQCVWVSLKVIMFISISNVILRSWECLSINFVWIINF